MTATPSDFESEVAAAFPCECDFDKMREAGVETPDHWRDCLSYMRVYGREIAAAVAARVRREARVCTKCRSSFGVVTEQNCEACSGTGIAWGKA